ncbi:hypothetical protein Bealeia1_01434 [Candidatus Bealeia paramacronuclearis]|uniref:Four-helix bundle copper-binding protein n=1 Tax=Candidatus Bealeia paramacronuclearis TaxID=1921001 RepID=A0ABZ2C466_9PROT|nr:hypothetical protein [Candidatus Bealeia paramacronuclearis]
MRFYNLLFAIVFLLTCELSARKPELKTGKSFTECSDCLDSLVGFCGQCSNPNTVLYNLNNMGTFCDPCKGISHADLPGCLTSCQEILNDAQQDLNNCFTSCQQTITQCQSACLSTSERQRYTFKNQHHSNKKK